MLSIVSLVLTAAGLLGADASEEAARRNIELWQGTWEVVSMETDGQPSPAEKLKKIKLTVTGHDYHFQNGTFSERGSYRFDISKDPKHVDIVVGEGADRGKTYLVIYKIERDELTLCLESANKARPREFTGKAGSGCVLEVWRRSAR